MDRRSNRSNRLTACITALCILGSGAITSFQKVNAQDAASDKVLPSAPSTGEANGQGSEPKMKIIELPPEPVMNHELSKTLDMQALRLATFPVLSLLKPIRLEARYEEPINLRDVLNYALRHNLPIKISKESWVYQKAQLWNQIGNFLPSFSTNWSLTNSQIWPNTVSNSRTYQVVVRYPVFQGGNVVYTALAQYYRAKGWHEAYFTTINDSLLDAYLKYTTLVLNHALLHIRAKSVEVSEAQLDLNDAQYRSGIGTRFAIMQSRTQLASDRQALLQQQMATRQAALALAYSLNVPMAINLVPIEESISEQAMIDDHLGINDLLAAATKHRPELRQYEYYKLSAARNVQVAASPLYPQASFFTAYTHSSTNVSAPSGGSGSGNVEGAGVFSGLFNTFQSGFTLSWTLPNFGTSAIANIVSARALSRQAMLQANQELLLVTQQVRQDYLTVHITREQIDNGAYGVASSAEALRLAELRLKAGVGTNLELIQAQRDYINALITQAQAIVASNQAQAQLLHDSGLISVDTLTKGYQPNGASR